MSQNLSSARPPARASAPGKIVLAGEYAVLRGAEAVALAVDRRAKARAGGARGDGSGAFSRESAVLRAARAAIAEAFGEESPPARAAREVAVNTAAFAAPDGQKLGLGSSAAAAAAAIACALRAGGAGADAERVRSLALRAHRDAQSGRGSGIDVAAACLGGLVAASLEPGGELCARPLPCPAELSFVAAFTGVSADTPTLLAAAEAAARARPRAYDRAASAIAETSRELSEALEREDAPAAVRALARGDAALADLDALVEPPLRLSAHARIGEIARARGGAAKPTGAGGGDLALAAFADAEAAARFLRELQDLGFCAFSARASTGVRAEPTPFGAAP